LLLADWAEQNDVGKTTSYALVKILKAMGIEPKFVRKKGASKPSPLLDGHALDAINHLLMQHRDGRSIAQLEVDHTAAIAPVVPTAIAAVHADDPAANDPEILLKRLEAAAMAQSTGLPLTKNEIQWILGAGLNSEAAAMARCRVEKRGRRWSLLAPSG
jgi:hypothetical protein